MKPFRVAVWLAALAAVVGGGGRAQAAWCNVFQVCCHNCNSPSSSSSFYTPAPSVSFSAPAADTGCPQPCPQPCPPQQCCTTRMVQRTYYQPVTSYEQRQQWEQVTSYRTSYFWEPVCSYRVSCHCDPCTGQNFQVSTPVTSYRLRSQCCPVQNWVSRCVTVPVTTQQAVSYYEPVTTCTQVPACPTSCPAPCASSSSASPQGAGVAVTPSSPQTGSGGAGVGLQSTQPPAVTNIPSDASRLDPAAATMPGATQSRSYRPVTPVPQQVVPVAPPVVRMDRIVSLRPSVEGQLLRADRSAGAGQAVVFRSMERPGDTRTVRSDARGRFQADLTSGTWEVSTQDARGSLVPQARIEVRSQQTRDLLLTSR